jgi:uncharacterized membrane protein
MAHAESSITVQQPVDVVYAFVLDGNNNPLWRPAIISIQHKQGTPDALGAVYLQQLKGPGGRPIAGDYEVVECQPNELIRFEVTAGPARPTGIYRFARAGAATTVTFALSYEPKGLARLLDPMIAQTMRSEVATLANLKAYLETHRD